jgi:hypothetical protein
VVVNSTVVRGRGALAALGAIRECIAAQFRLGGGWSNRTRERDRGL